MAPGKKTDKKAEATAEPPPPEPAADDLPASAQLLLELDGFEGPIDLLLTLARDQKVDLLHISIGQLADQYLAFIAEARRVRIELAADYLVMAAWLAYLKSRLLLPEPEQPEPEAQDMAAALAYQLRRLEAMREASVRLMARPRLGIDVFPRGAPEGVEVHRTNVYELTLFDLLKAYGEHRRRLVVAREARLLLGVPGRALLKEREGGPDRGPHLFRGGVGRRRTRERDDDESEK